MLRKLVRRYGRPEILFTERFPSCKAALLETGCADLPACGRWLNNRVESAHLPFRQRERARQRFRRMRILQKFVSVHAFIFNHFNRHRSFSKKDLSKRDVPPPWPSGAVSARQDGQRYCPCGDWFAFV
ncbi:DDE-type integrase/transposase/recombinase [Marimonas sp. MJW-29]|uniref:DDE-type integrase/transposase/recombinase n=1 Tax=Sulfitobacter sediminis TaxID=3234186 RepID=A0ABV3RQN1_9RHOB